MDGNKKIIRIVFAGFIALAITACKVQPTGYVGLYVDNLISVTDTTSPGETPLEMADTAATHVITTRVIEAGMPGSMHPAETFKTSSDSVYKQEVEKLLKAITDSVQLLRNQISEFQSQIKEMPDTSYTEQKTQEIQPPDSLLSEADFKQLIQVKDDTIAILRNQMTELKRTAHLKADTVNFAEESLNQFTSDSIHADYVTTHLLQSKNDTIEALRNQANELKKSAGLKADTVYITKETVKLIKGDSIQTDFTTNQLLQNKNDTIYALRNQVIELKKSVGPKTDTVYITKEVVKLLQGDSLQTDKEITGMVQTKNDTIAALNKKLNELQKSGIVKSDTVYVVRETVNSPLAERQQTEYQTQQLLRAKDEQIQMMQNQLNSLQNAVARTPQQTYIPREPAPAQPFSSQQTGQPDMQQFQAQNDTIQALKNQLRNLQQQAMKKDTVEVEKERKMLTTNELDSINKTSDSFRELQDSLQLLKTRVLSLEEQTLQDTIAVQDEKDVPFIAKTDTTLIVAFYARGGLKPLEEETVLKQIKDLSSTKNVTKITFAGFTDSSGSELVNKEITNKRLNYLSEKIIPWISKEKIFFQNFGDVFASDTMLSDERRIEIRILTQ